MSGQARGVGSQRPSVRQRHGRGGAALWVRDLRCGCGWTRTVAGWRAALAAADQHWRTHHRQTRQGSAA